MMETAFTWGNIITVVVVVVTGLLNYWKSTTKIEVELRQLKEQVERQNGTVARLQEWTLHHAEYGHSK